MAKKRELVSLGILLSSEDLIKEMSKELSQGHVEIRERSNGSWTLFYPQVAWIGCLSDCKLRHKHQTVQPMEQSGETWQTLSEAQEAAQRYAHGREVKVFYSSALFRPITCLSCDGPIEEGTGATYTLTCQDQKIKGNLCSECAEELPGKLVLPKSPDSPDQQVE